MVQFPLSLTQFLGLLLALGMAFFLVPAQADTALGERTESLGDALEKANAYSFETGGIGIIINYGTGNGISADDIGSIFIEEIKKRNQQSRYFVRHADWPGISMSFRIGHSSLGPWNPDEAAANIDQIINRAKAAQNIHGS